MKRASEWDYTFFKNTWEKVQRTVQLRVTDMERKRFQTGFLADGENGIKRANILELEVVMLVLKIQARADLITLQSNSLFSLST